MTHENITSKLPNDWLVNVRPPFGSFARAQNLGELDFSGQSASFLTGGDWSQAG
jgi:hypothetical protein